MRRTRRGDELILLLAGGDKSTRDADIKMAKTIAAALGNIARAKGMTEIAEATGLTREGLYRTLSKDGNPSFSSIVKVMKALGLKLKQQAA